MNRSAFLSLVALTLLLGSLPRLHAGQLQLSIRAEGSESLVVVIGSDDYWSGLAEGKSTEQPLRQTYQVTDSTRAGTALIDLDPLGDSSVAVVAFVDSNGNGELDLDEAGQPIERYVSNPFTNSWDEFIERGGVPANFLAGQMTIDLRRRFVLRVRVIAAKPEGMVYLALNDENAYLNNEGIREEVTLQPSDLGLVKAEFSVLPGRYCIRAFQDLNGNGALDFSLFGKPKEPFAIHRKPNRLRRNQPFSDIAFQVGRDPVAITLRLE